MKLKEKLILFHIKRLWLVSFPINESLLPGKMIHPMKLFSTIKLKLDKKEFYG